MPKLNIQEQNFTNSNNVIVNSNLPNPARFNNGSMIISTPFNIDNTLNPHVIHSSSITFLPNGIINVNHIEILFVMSCFTDIEISNNVNIKLKNHDPIQNITVDSGSLDFTNYYLNPNGAPVQFNLTLNSGGKFVNNVQSRTNSIENISQVTMAANTVFEFKTTYHHYIITPTKGIVLNDLPTMIRIAEFIDSKFNNSISDLYVENENFQGLREYANYQNKNALIEFIEMNFDVNCQAVNNFINDNALCIRGIETDLSDNFRYFDSRIACSN